MLFNFNGNPKSIPSNDTVFIGHLNQISNMSQSPNTSKYWVTCFRPIRTIAVKT